MSIRETSRMPAISLVDGEYVSGGGATSLFLVRGLCGLMIAREREVAVANGCRIVPCVSRELSGRGAGAGDEWSAEQGLVRGEVRAERRAAPVTPADPRRVAFSIVAPCACDTDPMRRSLFPEDDVLPTWLHTTLLFAIVAPLVAFCLWYGTGALLGGRLEPLSGPEFGQWLFGRDTLSGRAARIAGLSLLLWAGFFVALAFRFSRFDAATRRSAGVLPWALLALSIALSLLLPASR